MVSDAFVLSSLALIVTIGGGAIGHLYTVMYRLQEKSDVASAVRFKEFSELIERLSVRVEKERDLLTDARLKMATKEDLLSQTTVILREIDRRVAWTKEPGRGQLQP